MTTLIQAADAMAEALRPLLDIAAEVDRRKLPDAAHEMFLISAKEARTARATLAAYEAARREAVAPSDGQSKPIDQVYAEWKEGLDKFVAKLIAEKNSHD